MPHIALVDLDVTGLDLEDAKSPAALAWNELVSDLANHRPDNHQKFTTACGRNRDSPNKLLLIAREFVHAPEYLSPGQTR